MELVQSSESALLFEFGSHLGESVACYGGLKRLEIIGVAVTDVWYDCFSELGNCVLNSILQQDLKVFISGWYASCDKG